MDYDTLRSQGRLRIEKMSRRELKGFYSWFLDAIPERISSLEKAVKESEGFELWLANFEPSSLFQLGEWFRTRVQVRSRTSQEMASIRQRWSVPVEIPTWELTDRTISVAWDVGMYFGETVRKCIPNVRWSQALGKRQDVNYEYPVLLGFGRTYLNPVSTMITVASGLADGQYSEDELHKCFLAWKRLAGK